MLENVILVCKQVKGWRKMFAWEMKEAVTKSFVESKARDGVFVALVDPGAVSKLSDPAPGTAVRTAAEQKFVQHLKPNKQRSSHCCDDNRYMFSLATVQLVVRSTG